MRCKRCGSLMDLLIVDIHNRRYFVCRCGLSRLLPLSPRKRSGIYTCGHVQDQDGKPFVGKLMFKTSDKLHILTVTMQGEIYSREVKGEAPKPVRPKTLVMA